MKTVLWLAAIALLLPSLGARAQDTGQYRDDFGEVSYGGSDGNFDWTAPWVESESDGPGKGALHVGSEHCSNNNCLHIESSLLLPANLAISRKADLSGFAGADLSYDLYIDSLSTSRLAVEVSGGGSGWDVVDEYLLAAEDGEHSVSIDVSSYIGSDFEIRFRLEGLTGGGLVTVDRVVIEGAVQQSSTTTTTTSTTTTTPSTTTTHRSTTSTRPNTTTSEDATTTASPTTTPGDGRPASSDGGAASTGTGEETEHAVGGPPLSSSNAALPQEAGDPGPPNAIGVTGGLRDPGVGLLADYRTGLLGDLEFADTEVLGFDIDADFSMVVEVFEAAQIWIAALSLVVATAIIAGIDRRRRSERNRRP